MKHRAYLLLGSNIGDRAAQIEAANGKLKAIGRLTAKSGIYKTEPWEMDASQWFFNQVVELETNDLPQELLEHILEIEQSLGRVRSSDPSGGYTSRTIDIDILYYDEEVLDSASLTIPHPRIQDRRFALAPMVELNASYVHPVLHQSQFELLKICPDQSFLELL
ncbi:MAG: 2-amino-4-hydroxy-6-hydroxymethyldihydropteridine diphosphokinase [Flavobacteriales bacterium]|nr:2-amino-4-hydroxy-6-hydroxymethyldihydropteridine diphosphokinase [Flavobacteriales bacterium]